MDRWREAGEMLMDADPELHSLLLLEAEILAAYRVTPQANEPPRKLSDSQD